MTPNYDRFSCLHCPWAAEMRGGERPERLDFLARVLRAHVLERHSEKAVKALKH